MYPRTVVDAITIHVLDNGFKRDVPLEMNKKGVYGVLKPN
jgi:hypothetical protein